MAGLLNRLRRRKGGTDQLNLLLCGAQRSGTSSLRAYLESHPEIGFLDDEDLVIDGDDVGYPFASPVIANSRLGDDPDTYRKISARLSGRHRYIAAKHPYFMVQPQVPLNIARQLPDARLLFVLRNPIEAAYSAYRNGLAGGRRSGSFEENIKLSLEAGAEDGSQSRRGKWLKHFANPDWLPLLVDRGFYHDYLLRFHAVIDPAKIHVIRFEDLTRDTAGTMAKVLEFLELDPSHSFRKLDKVHNSSPSIEPMNGDTRAFLEDIYRDSNQKLFEMLGWDDNSW